MVWVKRMKMGLRMVSGMLIAKAALGGAFLALSSFGFVAPQFGVELTFANEGTVSVAGAALGVLLALKA